MQPNTHPHTYTYAHAKNSELYFVLDNLLIYVISSFFVYLCICQFISVVVESIWDAVGSSTHVCISSISSNISVYIIPLM